jgi:hypothetical protein
VLAAEAEAAELRSEWVVVEVVEAEVEAVITLIHFWLLILATLFLDRLVLVEQVVDNRVTVIAAVLLFSVQ